MKGVIFTEFLDFADRRLGTSVVETALAKLDLPSGGAYTAVGTYAHGELVAILNELCRSTGHQPTEMLREFGRSLFPVLARSYPALVQPESDVLTMLERIDSVIHVEVLKLYPDAQLPTFHHERRGPHELVLDYRSERSFGDLAEGLLRGCIEHFQEPVEITREDVSGTEGRQVRFILRRK